MSHVGHVYHFHRLVGDLLTTGAVAVAEECEEKAHNQASFTAKNAWIGARFADLHLRVEQPAAR